MLIPRWFLLLNGVGLLIMGGMLLYGRLREDAPWSAPRRFFGLLWSLLCLCVGVALVLMGQGYLPQPGEGRPADRPARPVDPRMGTKPGPVFPTGQ